VGELECTYIPVHSQSDVNLVWSHQICIPLCLTTKTGLQISCF